MAHDMSSNLPEVYHGPEHMHNPHVVNNNGSDAPEIAQHNFPGGNPGYTGGHQSTQLPPYKSEYSTHSQQVPQSPWSPPPPMSPPPPHNYQQTQPPQIFPPQQQQQQQPPAKKNTICGMKKAVFWIVFAIVLIIIIGAAVGAGVGVSMKNKKNSDYTPYALQTGSWDINNAPLSQYNGICNQDYDTAAVGCGPLTFLFDVSKIGNNYQITNSIYTGMNGILTPPKSDTDFYTRVVHDNGQAPFVTANCFSNANITVKLSKNYQYEFSNEHFTPSSCELDNGLTSTPNQACNCYWFGYL